MLKLKHLIENFDLAREALTHFDHDEDTLDACLAHFRISANAIYPYANRGQARFLRLAPTDEKDEGELRAELEFLHYLASEGYPALRPVCAHNGAGLLHLKTRWGEYFACAFTGVPGMPIESLPMTEELVRAYGSALARLHALSSRYEPSHRRQSHAALLRQIRTHCTEYGAPEELLLALDALEQELALLVQTRDTYGLVHYDFEPDNVFFDPSKGIFHVIDFDDSIYCWYALDIEQALDCIDPAAHAAFLAGYASVRPLPDDFGVQRGLMRRLIDLRACSRLIRSLAEPVDPQPDWMPGLRAKLQARCSELCAKISASLDEQRADSL